MVGLLTQRKQKQKGEQERLLPITTGQQIAATLLQEQNQKHSLPIITGPVFNANNAVADAVICCLLLFCLETWVLTSSMLNSMRGFNYCACRWCADKKPRRQQNGTLSTVLLMKL